MSNKKNIIKSFLIKLTIMSLLWIGVAIMFGIFYYSRNLPDLYSLQGSNDIGSVRVTTETGELIANYGMTHGDIKTFDQFPSNLINAVVAIEDRRFFTHGGIDPLGIIRASYANYRAGEIRQGGSTVTQQLAKNIFLTPEKTFSRKIQEAIIALKLEKFYSKKDIMAFYLNRAYFGVGNYGAESASKNYFGKSVEDLNLYESAMLAGLLKAPTRFSPANNMKLAQKRTDQVLAAMVDAGYIDRKTSLKAHFTFNHANVTATPSVQNRFFGDWVMKEAERILAEKGMAMDGSNLIIRTTLNLAAQKAAENTINDTFQYNYDRLKNSEVALLSIDLDGKIIAMIGGKDYDESSFNRASQAHRQPGSAFKILPYLAGLEHGMNPDDIFVDQPLTISNWSPDNYNARYFGEVTMEHAFAHSLNSVAVQINEKAGRENVISLARRLGIASRLAPHPSIALGSFEVTMPEITNVYATIANRGNKVTPYGIISIKNSAGEVLYKMQSSVTQKKILTDDIIVKANRLLLSVVREGTGRQINLPIPAAGKTGTSQDFRDAWFIGFAGPYTTAVWIGNDNNSPTKNISGGSFPSLIWAGFMRQATNGLTRYIPTRLCELDSLVSCETGETPPHEPPAESTPTIFEKLLGI